jgi:hypothetical protein
MRHQSKISCEQLGSDQRLGISPQSANPGHDRGSVGAGREDGDGFSPGNLPGDRGLENNAGTELDIVFTSHDDFRDHALGIAHSDHTSNGSSTSYQGLVANALKPLRDYVDQQNKEGLIVECRQEALSRHSSGVDVARGKAERDQERVSQEEYQRDIAADEQMRGTDIHMQLIEYTNDRGSDLFEHYDYVRDDMDHDR